MSRSLTLLLFCFFFVGFNKPPPRPDVQEVETFTNQTVGRFPKTFEAYPFQKGKAHKVYHVREEGTNRYLEAMDDKNISVQTMKRFKWDRKVYPIFSWKWRVKALPKGADERTPGKNDSACGVYVVFGSSFGKALKYVWSTSAPVGTENPQEKNFYLFVKASGSSRGNQWQRVTINIANDHQKAFGTPPQYNPIGFAILTDGNATDSTAACDYDDFTISKN
ncbi:MAG: DUF3047 domain-containing protein [Deltaproteobacteria bacterium]|nr:DUF3047 domain-containing protein [Deltaproteobacteria bacterium]